MLRRLFIIPIALCLFTYSFYIYTLSTNPIVVYTSGEPTAWGSSLKERRQPLCEHQQQIEPQQAIIPKPQIKQTKIVFLKTHKTASTTLASMIFRFGHRHGLRFLPSEEHYIRLYDETMPKGPFDITLYHHRLSNDPHPEDNLYYFEQMRKFYSSRIPDAQFISVLRDPLKRQLSEYYYFFEPEGVSIDQFIVGDHPMRDRSDVHKDLGVFTMEAAKKYIETDFDNVFMAITEMLPESLMLLRQKMGWSMQDMLYMHLLDACKGNVTRWDGKQVKCAPKNPPAELVTAIKERTEIEQMIYDAAKNKIVRLVKEQPPQFAKDLATYKQMLSELQTRCQPYALPNTPESTAILANASLSLSSIPLECYLYLIPDMVYQNLILQAHKQNVPLNAILPIIEYN